MTEIGAPLVTLLSAVRLVKASPVATKLTVLFAPMLKSLQIRLRLTVVPPFVKSTVPSVPTVVITAPLAVALALVIVGIVLSGMFCANAAGP